MERFLEWRTRRQDLAKIKKEKAVPWRKNVLALMLAGYGIIFFMFFGMVLTKVANAEGAYDFIQNALMALIGGSIAISKDIIGIDKKDGDDATEGSEGAS